MTKSEYIEELKLLFRQHIGEYDVDHDNLKRYLYCPLSCQGYSKNKKGHFEVNYDVGVCYCYRCVEGSSIYSMLKQFKNSENRGYINNLLRIYFTFYEHTDSKNDKGYLQKYASYDFTLQNAVQGDTDNLKFTNNHVAFLKHRFPTLTDGEILKTVKEFHYIPIVDDHSFHYKSFFNKFVYMYLLENGNYIKSKAPNPSVYNDRKDYYYNVTSYMHENLYLSEGIIDLMTIATQDPLMNATNSNFLAFCSRNYKFIYEFLLNSGKFFYNNMYLIIDNDVNRTAFINGVIKKLGNGKRNPKFKLFNNLYVMEVPKTYLDLNDLYITTHSLKEISITKII